VAPRCTHVLVLLDLVPRAPVTVAVPGDLGALGEAVEVEGSTGDGTRDDADKLEKAVEFGHYFYRHRARYRQVYSRNNRVGLNGNPLLKESRARLER